MEIVGYGLTRVSSLPGSEERRRFTGFRALYGLCLTSDKLGVDLKPDVEMFFSKADRIWRAQASTHLGGDEMSDGIARYCNVGSALAIVCHEYIDGAIS